MNEDTGEATSYFDKEITPKDLLKFARQILSCLALLFIFSCFADWLFPGRGIFDCCKTALPSIATLVIGYYFGKTS